MSLRPACRPAWSRARGSGPTTGRKEFQTGKAHTGWSNGDDRISSSSPRRFPRFMCAEYNYLNKRRAVVLDSYLVSLVSRASSSKPAWIRQKTRARQKINAISCSLGSPPGFPFCGRRIDLATSEMGHSRQIHDVRARSACPPKPDISLHRGEATPR